jgi:hypothetical protein
VIITLTGGNSFALRKRFNELVDSFVKEHGELALERLDGEEVDVQVIIDVLQNLPFLATRKMVVVRELGVNKQAVEKI